MSSYSFSSLALGISVCKNNRAEIDLRIELHLKFILYYSVEFHSSCVLSTLNRNLGNLSAFSLFDAAVDLRCSEYNFDIVHKTDPGPNNPSRPSVQFASRQVNN